MDSKNGGQVTTRVPRSAVLNITDKKTENMSKDALDLLMILVINKFEKKYGHSLLIEYKTDGEKTNGAYPVLVRESVTMISARDAIAPENAAQAGAQSKLIEYYKPSPSSSAPQSCFN